MNKTKTNKVLDMGILHEGLANFENLTPEDYLPEKVNSYMLAL